jgi:predicted transcriptional regulator
MLDRLLKRDTHDYKAKDLMTKAVMTAVPQDNLLKAQNMMSRYGIKNVVVIDSANKRYPVGILSHNKRYYKISNIR